MDPSEKLKNSFKLTVERSTIPYLLLSKTDESLQIVAASPKCFNIIGDSKEFITSGNFLSYINNIYNLPVGKTLSDLIYYKNNQIEINGEKVNFGLFLIQVTLLNTSFKSSSEYAQDLTTGSLSELTKTIYELKSSLDTSTLRINNLKEDLLENRQRISNIESNLHSIKSKILEELKFNGENLKYQVVVLQEKIVELKDNLLGLENNTLLKFTSDISFKKGAAILGVLLSLGSSLGLFNGWIVDSIDGEDNLENKIEQLLDLTDD